MSIVIDLLVMVLRQFQQTFLEIEIVDSPALAYAWDREPESSAGASGMADDASRAPETWGRTDETDVFHFNGASLRDQLTAGSFQRHGEPADELTVYDRIVSFLMSGASEAELADMRTSFSLSQGLDLPAEVPAYEF